MKQTVDAYTFRRAFEDHGRADQFSADALDALFDFYQEFEASTGEELELDVIAICCDWVEYDSAIEAVTDLSALVADEDENEDEQSALEYLQDRTTVIELDSGSIVVQAF